MIEAMLTNTMLVLGVALLMLVINYRFRKYSGLLLWTEGIGAIVGTMLGIGLGWIRLFLSSSTTHYHSFVRPSVKFPMLPTATTTPKSAETTFAANSKKNWVWAGVPYTHSQSKPNDKF